MQTSARTGTAGKSDTHGPGYVRTAAKKLSKASKDLVTWTKTHPVTSTASATAAAALLTAGALLYASMKSHGRAGSTGKSTRRTK